MMSYQSNKRLHRIGKLPLSLTAPMSRPFHLEISESLEFLEQSLRHARSARQTEKLQMLWWIKSGQVTQHQELGHRLNRNGSTVSRWLQQYRSGGLKTLLAQKCAPGAAWKIDGEVLEALKAKLRQPEGFRSYGAVQTWLQQSFGLEVEYATVYKTVRYRLGAKLKAPRPRSLKQNAEAVSRYKKTSRLPY